MKVTRKDLKSMIGEEIQRITNLDEVQQAKVAADKLIAEYENFSKIQKLEFLEEFFSHLKANDEI
tara:strand:+ start:611 stop:805 length:195 start_codon:yes stop_codon:yes gene_type:complete